MKKGLSILLSLVLIFTVVVPVLASIEMNNLEVVTDSFDNTIFDAYQKVIIKSDTVDFTAIEDTLSIYLSGTNKESIKNVNVIDSDTITFDMLVFNVPSGLYSLILDYKDNNMSMQQWSDRNIIVKAGHFIVDDEPLTIDEIVNSGITIKFYNTEIEGGVTAMLDDVSTDSTKVSNRVFKVYPTKEQLLNKDEIEVRLVVADGYYKTMLRIIDSAVYLEKTIYSREEPFSFYINSKVVEFPVDTDVLNVVITGRGRYIDITDLVLYNEYKIKANTSLPLAYGIYNLALSWEGSETYNMEFEVVDQNTKDNNELSNSVLDFLDVDDTDITLTLYDDQALRYVESESKLIDLTMYPFEKFTLDLRNDALNILIDNNLGLTINFDDYQFIITKDSLVEISTKDAYMIAQKTDEFPDIDDMYYEISGNLYMDSNIQGIKIMTEFNQEIKTFSKVELLVYDFDLELNNEKAYKVNDMIYGNYMETGTYKFVAKANKFSDVDSSYWGVKYIAPLTTIGIIDGMGDGTFLPEGEIERAQFAKLVAVSLNLPTGDGLSYFSDVYTTDWYYNYMVALEKANIIEGDYFKPGNDILRKDMAVMVMKAYAYYTGEDLQLLANESFAAFTDLGDLTAEEITCILAAQKLGIIDGMTLTSYAPQETATRTHAAAIIYRFMKSLELI